MSRPLQVLLVEDNPADADLVVLELQRAGFSPQWLRVESEAGFAAYLRADLDIVLSDYSLPDFSGMRALEMLRESGLDVPFIIISGTIGEDMAVAAMKLGAADYLLKDRLARLGPAVELAMEQASLRRERAKAESALILFRTLVDQSNDTIEVIDPETGRFLDVNQDGPDELGITRSEYLLLRMIDLDPSLDEADWPAFVEKIRTTGSLEVEGCRMRMDGSKFPIEFGAKWVPLDRGYIVAVVRNITERKKHEQQMLRAQRMESLGALAGGIAHDLNNVLSPIMMSLAVLKLRFPDAASQQTISLIGASARHGADMVQQILSFARGVEGRRVPIQIGPLIREIGKITAETFPRNISIKSVVPPELWRVSGDPTQLHQVLLNLCINARDAMPGGGSLTLAAEDLTLDPPAGSHASGAPPGNYVLIRVEDNGTGMVPGIIGEIFEPFFTTKEAGRGTGRGLSTSLAVVKSHGGFIHVDSHPGSGTLFQILIPALTDSPSPDVEMKTPEPTRGNGELILVVDDEASLREMTRQTLEAFGYRVIVACDGIEAISACATHGAEITAALVDLNMPVMDGAATIQVLHKMNPALRVITVSGSAADDGIPGVHRFLSKPYTAESLLLSLKDVILSKTDPETGTRP